MRQYGCSQAAAGNAPLNRPIYGAPRVDRRGAKIDMAGRKASARREPASDGSQAAASNRKRGGRSAGRSLLRRMVYWCLVLAVWGVIGAVGAFAYVVTT